ncbi:MAG: DUF2752 domain-containing protein [Paludibacteraceae bacterium]|nr:DUF2752 domain-containing protein [Paludibacteraceae bacterium]
MASKNQKIIFWGVLFVIGGIMLYFLNPTQYALMPKCPVKFLTGLNCPGCGFQRAVHALLHGRFEEALKYNLFFAYAVPYLLAVFIANIALKGEKQIRILKFLEGRFMAITYVIIFSVWFVVRNIYHI